MATSDSSQPSFVNCTISGNSAALDGGALHLASPNIFVYSTAITGNHAQRCGGAAALELLLRMPSLHAFFNGSIITNNSAGVGGGGVFWVSADTCPASAPWQIGSLVHRPRHNAAPFGQDTASGAHYCLASPCT